MDKLITVLFMLFCYSVGAQFIPTELACKPVDHYPWVQYVNNFQTDENVYVALDPDHFSELINKQIDIYIVESRTSESYMSNPSLVDVRGSAQQELINGSNISDNIFKLEQSDILESINEYGFGVKYDIIFDVDNDQILSNGDLIDGLDVKMGGFNKVHDTSAPGPFKIAVNNYTNPDQWLNKRIYYPENIESLEKLPLVVVSHGWTFDQFMYNYIGEHLASYGYIVVIHANDVGDGGPSGTHSSSITTLNNTNHFIGSQNEILNGVFNGHVDNTKIAFLGHSTGGEGIVRAYTKLVKYQYQPDILHFTYQDIKLLCSFAPVAWLTVEDVDPGFANYHLFSGGADLDASLIAASESGYQQSFSIFERSKGNRQLTYIHGVGHTDLTSCGGCYPFLDEEAPGLIGQESTNKVVKSYLLPLLELYLNDNPVGKEYFTRMYDDFHPIGIPSFIQIAKEYKSSKISNKIVLDDFQTNQELNKSSSGSQVSYDVDNIFEIEMRDNDNSFSWTGNQQSNGFSRSKNGDSPRCVILDWDSDKSGYYTITVPDDIILKECDYLSFRACQGTQHPNTNLLNGGLSIGITLKDYSGNSSTITTANYGLINQPYQRKGGWVNEFETIMIRLADFGIDNSDFDLFKLETISFNFGTNSNSTVGRLAIDDIELIEGTEYCVAPPTITTSIDIVSPKSKLTLFPNPVVDELVIQGLKKDDKIYIVNNLGQLIEFINNTGFEIQYSMKDLVQGVYLFHIVSDNRYQIIKVIKI